MGRGSRGRRVFVAVVGVLVVLSGCGDDRPEAAPDAPNVLVIVMDDMRSDQVDVMPTVKKVFADGGTTFTQAFAQSPQCCPARASILSGRTVHNHGVLTNLAEDSARFEERLTIERYLQDAGYQTAIVGKYFNEWDAKRRPIGFDRWAIMHAAYERVPFQIGDEVKRVSQYSTDFIGDQAVGLLRDFQRDRDRPWFLYLAPIAPHFPYTPAPRHASADVGEQPRTPAVTEADLSDKPEYVRTYPNVHFFGPPERVWQLQRRTLLSADEMIARVLEQAGRDRRSTLMVFVSDNGYLLGEHGVTEAKRLPYPEAVKVPMYLRWPGRVRAGAVDDRPVMNVDIAPTIAEAAGIDPPTDPPFDGRSLLGSHRRRSVVLEQFPETPPDRPNPEEPTGLPNPAWFSIWTPEAQYTEWFQPGSDRRIFREFYDVRRDPFQLENRFGRRASPPPARTVAMMARELERARTCRGTSGPNPCP